MLQQKADAEVQLTMPNPNPNLIRNFTCNPNLNLNLFHLKLHLNVNPALNTFQNKISMLTKAKKDLEAQREAVEAKKFEKKKRADAAAELDLSKVIHVK